MRFFIGLFLLLSVQSYALTLHGAFTQGGFVVGKTTPHTQVYLNKKTVKSNAQGYFFMGLHRYFPTELTVYAIENGQKHSQTVFIIPREYKTQHIKGVPSKTVNPNKQELARAVAEQKEINAARAYNTPLEAFYGTFQKPIENKIITGVYGSRRIYDGQERKWHKGTDFAAAKGVAVKAPATGIVRLAKNTFFSGNLIILDHGGKLFTSYAHLSEINVKVGDTITSGQLLGRVGSTGRSTGPHLHWAAYWKNIPIDAILLVQDK